MRPNLPFEDCIIACVGYEVTQNFRPNGIKGFLYIFYMRPNLPFEDCIIHDQMVLLIIPRDM